MIDILSLDVATTTGWARGRLDAVPTSGSVRFGARANAAADDIFASALVWAQQIFAREPRPDMLIIEELLPPDINHGRTTRAVRDRLAGLHGIMRAAARHAGIAEITSVSVSAVRAHFISNSRAPRVVAKGQTLRMCRLLGWPACDDNAADALAVWSYGCALVKPQSALRLVPLFHRVTPADIRR